MSIQRRLFDQETQYENQRSNLYAWNSPYKEQCIIGSSVTQKQKHVIIFTFMCFVRFNIKYKNAQNMKILTPDIAFSIYLHSLFAFSIYFICFIHKR